MCDQLRTVMLVGSVCEEVGHLGKLTVCANECAVGGRKGTDCGILA